MQALHLCFVRSEAEALYGGLPSYATEGAAGLDLRACLQAPVVLAPGQRVLVPTGIAIQPIGQPSARPDGQLGEHESYPAMAGFVYSRSGLGAKHGITVAQGVGVIDADYRGEIMVMLLNTQAPGHTSEAHSYTIECGERIAQLVFQPIFRPAITLRTGLEESQRGGGGFGHTGKS